MLVENIVSGNKYDVREKMGTYQASKSDLIFTRVGKIADHWEFVSGKITSLGQFDIDKRISSQWIGDKNKLTPKIMYELFYSKNKEAEIEEDEEIIIDSQNAREKLEQFLKKRKLFERVNVNLIDKWLYEEGEKGAFLKSAEDLPLVFYGIVFDCDDRNEIMGEAMPLLSDFANSVGRKRFKGKSPQQMASENSQKEVDPSWKSSMKQISADGVDFFAKGSILMKEQNFREAQSKFEEGFSSLLKEKIPIIDIYRAYANLAVCLFSQGKVARGKKLLKISLELNPTYGFAKSTLKKIENGFFDQAIEYGRRMSKKNEKTEKDDSKDYAIIFFDFLKSTGINFATKEPPFEMVSTLNGKKIPRNEPCPCGSGKKYKHCCGA